MTACSKYLGLSQLQKIPMGHELPQVASHFVSRAGTDDRIGFRESQQQTAATLDTAATGSARPRGACRKYRSRLNGTTLIAASLETVNTVKRFGSWFY